MTTKTGGARPRAAGLTPGGRTARRGLLGRIRRYLLGISVEETRARLRGLVRDPTRAARMIETAEAFLVGYHAALSEPRPAPLAETLDRRVARGWRGFAYEGAGMALALQDSLVPRPGRRPGRLETFLAGPGSTHRYLVLVGAGWGFARVPRRTRSALAGLDPLLRWLVIDGYGFHEGYFRGRRALERRRVPRRLGGYARRAFDQGLGRSLWFARGTEAGRIAAAVASLPRERRGDLWSGVGLASAFACDIPVGELAELRRLAGPWAFHAAQGVAFAAKARLDSGEGAAWLERPCTVFCEATPAEAATLAGRTALGLPDDGGSLTAAEPSYETWRRRTREALASRVGPGGSS